MPFQIIRDDITRMRVDAIVNTASPSLLGGGGVDGAIHRAAGPQLKEACRSLGGCRVGEVKVTDGFDLPCRYVLHTVGPIWKGGFLGEEAALRRCYNNALETAESLQCESIAFPLISGGAFAYPAKKALRVAVDCITAFVLTHDLTVYLVLYGAETVLEGRSLFPDIQEYIDDHYVEKKEKQYGFRRRRRPDANISGFDEDFGYGAASQAAFSEPMADEVFPESGMPSVPETTASFPSVSMPPAPAPQAKPAAPRPGKPPREDASEAAPASAPYAYGAEHAYEPETLDWLFEQIDESFQQMLLRKIDESGMTDAQCYKKANVDRKLFSKIRKDVQYRPSKPTAIAFAIALELSLPETEDLLNKAGYALSRSSRFDLIIRFFIEKRRYDIFEINEALFFYDQSLLGG